MPQNSRNWLEKCAAEEKPRERAIPAIESDGFVSMSRAFWMRQWAMNAAGGNPVMRLNDAAKRLSHWPVSRAIPSIVRRVSGCSRMSLTSSALAYGFPFWYHVRERY